MNRTIAHSAMVATPRGELKGRWASIRSAATRFLATPASPLPFGVLRIGLGLLLIAQTLAVAPNLFDFYGSLGLIQAPVVDAIVWPLTPRLSWVIAALSPLGFDEPAVIRLAFVFHLLSAMAFLLGWRTRVAAVCLWITNLTLMTTAAPHTYGFDMFVKIALFYCMFAPIGSALSFDVIAGRTSGAASSGARLSLRVLQAHLAVVYAATGIEKASGIQWWNGEALWRTWMRADLGTIDFSWVAWTPWIAAIGCWTTLVLEIGYAIFIWPKRTRTWWALAIVALHVGIVLTLGLVAFACIMIVLTFSAWLVPYEPRSLRAARQSGFTVAYDGSCRVCRSVVGLALAVGRCGFTPVGRSHGRRIPALAGLLDLDAMRTVTRDGRISAGADAFFSMWAHVFGWPWLQKLARLSPVRAGYSLFAKHRRSFGCRSGCARRNGVEIMIRRDVFGQTRADRPANPTSALW